MRLLRLVLGSLAVCAASRATASDVVGRVTLAGKGPAKDAVVYLEGGRKAEPMANVVVDQRRKTFLPHVSVVTVGTTVVFPNHDTVFHNVFAYYNAKKFDLGMYPRGASKSVMFDKKGLVALLCNVHSEMSAYIMVVDTPYFTVADREGRFRVSDVPAGTYTLHAWHESGSAVTQTIIVTDHASELDLRLTRR